METRVWRKKEVVFLYALLSSFVHGLDDCGMATTTSYSTFMPQVDSWVCTDVPDLPCRRTISAKLGLLWSQMRERGEFLGAIWDSLPSPGCEHAERRSRSGQAGSPWTAPAHVRRGPRHTGGAGNMKNRS